MKRIVILGGGTGGTLTASRQRRSGDEQAAGIVVVDHDADHVYQPGLPFVPFGLTSMQRIVRPRRQQFRSGISFRQTGIDRADVEADRVRLDDVTALSYDVLAVATGARLPEENHGLTGSGCSGSPKMTSLNRSRTSRSASSMPSRPEARSFSPDRAACLGRGVGGVTAAKPGSQYPLGYAWHHSRSVRNTHVQPSCLRPLQEDHLDGLRPACGAGPRRGPAREPLHLSAKTSLNGGQAAST